MRAKDHKIADAVFNFAFASADETVRGAAVLPGLIKAQLVPCMDDVFDRWGTDQDVVRIDHLAVDLGCVAYEDMARVLAQRLEQALNAALQDRSPADRIPPHQAGLDLIAHYLQAGTVPWTAEKSSPAELNRILGTLIDQAPHPLVAFLQSQNQKANPVLPRLARQFKPDLLLRLAARLAPAAAPPLSRLVNALAALYKAAALASVSDRELVGALWESILHQLLLPGGRSISPHTLVANALYATAARHGVSRSRLCHHLTRSWQLQRITTKDIETEKFVTAVSRHQGPDGAQHEDPHLAADQWAPLAFKLLDALLGHRTDGFAGAWSVMVTRFAGPTRQVVRQTARQARVRRAIARRFTPRQFRQLVVLLEPRHAHFVNAVLEHQKTLGQAMHRTPATPETMGVHLRKFTLAYLLSEGATRFNRKQYCAGMIHRLAARHNMAYEALLEDFHTFFSSAVAAHDDTSRQLKEILDEIRLRPIGTQTPSQESSSAPPALTRDLSDRMRTGLQRGQPSVNAPAAAGRDADVMLIESEQHYTVPAAARRQDPDSEETKASIAVDGAIPPAIRAALGRDNRLSGLTAALKRRSARHAHWSRLLTHVLLEMNRDPDPEALVQQLIQCLHKADRATIPDVLYPELRRELTALRPVSNTAGGPSGVSERAGRQSPSENQARASHEPLPEEIRAVPGRDINLSGLTAAPERLAACCAHWSRLLTHVLLEMNRDPDPEALVQQLIQCLHKADRATIPDVLYPELRRELAALRPPSNTAGGPSGVSETAGRQSPSENQTRASHEPLPEEIRAVSGRDINLSGLTAAPGRLAACCARWSRLLTHVLLEMSRDLDPEALVQQLIQCLHKADRATIPDVLYPELRRELAALRPPSNTAGGPSGVSETAGRQSPSENQARASHEPLPEEIRAVPGRDINLSGLTAAPGRPAAHHPHWFGLLTHVLLEMNRDLEPVALIQHLIRCLNKADRAMVPSVLYQELRCELAADGPLPHGAEEAPAQMVAGHGSGREPPPLDFAQAHRTLREPTEAAVPDPSVFVQNAGLVLAAPYLPRLFGMLGLTEKNRFNHCAAAERAVHLLEFIANERTSAPEFQLALNKLFCGLAASTPIIPGMDITPKERSAVDSLIRSIIEHWKILGNTSPEGLRTSFLQREGYLTLKDNGWHLQVEQRSYDMLLDRLPWSYAVIKHPWMTRMLYVNWRPS